LNGSLQPLRNSKGQILAEESLTQDEKGALHRHVVDSSDGSSFDARATLSPDANTITDVVTAKTKDGKVFEMTMVWRRSGAGEVGVVPPSARIAAQAGEITKTLQQRYSDWMNAFRRGDGATMDKMEADGLVLVFQDGEIWSKERSRVEELKGRGPLPVTHTLEEVRVRTNGDVAIVTGVQNDVSTKDGGKSRTAFTSVWKREAGDWKVWSAHWSDATQKK
ncbi:MAG: nuclear transport factor 2 family protein, partial [Vicinamibacterales bacterium]